MSEVSILRLHLLRAVYLLIAIGMGMQIWPGILVPGNVSHMGSAVRAMLGGLTLMCAWGFFYPVKMLPILLFELAWKVIWVAAFGAGPWLRGELEPDRRETLFACALGVVVVPIVIPWGYVVRQYIRAPIDPWRRKKVGA